MKNYSIISSVFLLLLLTCKLSFAQQNPAYNGLSYYVVAHQDDWQLFMGTNAANDIKSNAKVVIVYVSAGDLDGKQEPYGIDLDTHDPNPYINRTVPYYQIREVGATYSLHLVAENSSIGYCFEAYPTITFPSVNGHPIKRYEYRNTVSYFLRLVDLDLAKMNLDHTIPGATIDTSTTYTNWCDLTSTIANILVRERINSSPGFLNIAEIDTNLNPNDHQSHTAAAKAALYAVNYHLNENYPTALFIGYETQNLAPNLGVVDAANEAGMLAAYNLSLINHRIWNEWITAKNIIQQWCGRNYYRVLNSNEFSMNSNCTNNPNEMRISHTTNKSGLISPNPSSSFLTVPIESETDNNSEVLVYDTKGIIVVEQKCQQNTPVKVDVSHFVQGTYFVHIVTKNGTSIQKAVVLRE